MGLVSGEVRRTESRAGRGDGTPGDGGHARSGAYGLFQFPDWAVLPHPLRASTHRLPPLRVARLRRACGRESETRRPPCGTRRVWVHSFSIQTGDRTPPADLWIRSGMVLLGYPWLRVVTRVGNVVIVLTGGVRCSVGR